MNKTVVFAVVAVLGLVVQGFADLIKLNSGETITGEIVLDAGPVVQIRVPNESGTIFSLRDVLRSDIKEIRRGATDPETAMQEAFQNSRRYQLTTYSYPIVYYDNVISNVFVKFLSAYPQSLYCPDMQNTLKSWTAERNEVAAGSIKQNNQWCRGDEAKKMVATIQVTQLVSEGDRQLYSKRYESAINLYRKALQQRPLTENTIGMVQTKCSHAFSEWTTAASTAPDNSKADIQARAQRIQQLQSQIQTCNTQIDSIQNELALIASAQWISVSGSRCSACGCTQKHWIAPGRDFGAVLPDARSLAARAGLTQLQGRVATAEKEITRLNTEASVAQSGTNPTARVLASIQNLQAQLATDVTKARSGLPSPDLPQAAETTVLVVSVTTQEAASAQQTADAETSHRTRIVNPAATPQPGERVPWWKEHWILLCGICLVVLYLASRRS